MEEQNLTLIAIAVIGFAQVGLNVALGLRNNKANAKKSESEARSVDESVYGDLVDRLEKRLDASAKREQRLEERIAALEGKCDKYEGLIQKYEHVIETLE